ncbi:hypothetical protein COY28_00090 [Candidatus Woesearchaeota archaeon CG_4_10_14_0_2_um_filter_57_5]|nr:MAG: hypothetical protein COY28_00090 [Candidatus Woesearchaeota archaeon CG_4_10_14_0_2_um_filter_57_5]
MRNPSQRSGRNVNLQAVTPQLVRIGKSGLSPGVVDEIARQLKRHKLVKVKFLRSFIEGKSATDQANDLLALLRAANRLPDGMTLSIAQVRGFTALLAVKVSEAHQGQKAHQSP